LKRLPATTVYYAAELWLSFAFAVSFTVTGVYFVVEVGMNPLELVLTGTAMELAIFLFEIPTGVVADTYSRRASLVVGWAVMGLALGLVGLAGSVLAVLLLYALWGIGYTFTSGAHEAWITDEVGVERVGRIFARGQQLGYVGGLLGVGISVAIASWSIGAAVSVGGALVSAFALFAIATMPEHGFTRRPVEERGSALHELGTTAARGGRFVRAQPLLLLIFAIFFFAGASTESFDRLWEAHFIRDVGLPGLGSLDPVVWFGIFEAGSMLIGLAATQLLVRRFERSGQERLARLLLLFTAVQVAGVLVFAVAGTLALALAGFWLYYLTRSLIGPVERTWLNQTITDSSVRATVISMSGQSDAIGQVAGGPGLGAIGTVFSLRTGLLAGGALLAPAIALYARAVRHHGREPELAELPEAVGS
jgi:MFS transporter, DHA3 family, tetracycline resistance protein